MHSGSDNSNLSNNLNVLLRECQYFYFNCTGLVGCNVVGQLFIALCPLSLRATLADPNTALFEQGNILQDNKAQSVA
jgi:hypothetical protein